MIPVVFSFAPIHTLPSTGLYATAGDVSVTRLLMPTHGAYWRPKTYT
jgi:hypothetical protein